MATSPKSKVKPWEAGSEDPMVEETVIVPATNFADDLRTFVNKAHNALAEANIAGDQVLAAKFDTLIHSSYALLAQLNTADASVLDKVL